MAVSRQDILGSARKVEPIDVPEWGGTAYLKVLSVGQLMAFLEAREQLHPFQAFALLAAHSLCDDQGRALFAPEDAAALEEQGFAVLDRIAKAALKLNRMAAGDDEAAAKNS